MLGVKDEWQILKTGSRADFLTIAAIMGVFILIVAMNIFFIFQMTAHQTESLGQLQMENIRSELQRTIDDAERMTLRVAMRAEQMLASGASHDEIKDFFMQEQREQKILSNGECFNVYIAQRDWILLPEGTLPDSFHVTDRNWYKGAAQTPGKVFITEPYLDAVGHGLCFSVSMMLSDKNTVVALDFNFSNAQKSIDKLNIDDDRTALIVTKDGLIVGYRDKSLVGENLKQRLPEYQRILDAVLKSNTRDSFKTEIAGRSHTVFSSLTDNGWYMILCVNNSALYHDDYNHLMLSFAVNVWMILIMVFYSLNSMKNRLQALKALRAKEEFLSNISKELHRPIQKILKLSNAAILGGDDNPAESAAKARECALQLSDMINNLLSFSTLVKEDPDIDKKAEKNLHLSKVSRTARRRIIAVLTIALIFRVGISIHTNLGWGDTKMTRDVETYENRLTSWVVEQKSILGMFASVISERPELMNDYAEAVKFLDDIAQEYPEISACYLANPDKAHPLIMNDGWTSPDPDWKVNQRPWYIETENSSEAFTVSTPYIDSRTGNYCVTVAQVVHGKDGEFIGIFGIDFYLDRLIQILDDSYTAEGYAFLVDKRGMIINHPHAAYQMTPQKMIAIDDTEYKEVYKAGEQFLMQDFSGDYMTCLAKTNEPSGFTVVVANKWNNIYGQAIIFPAIFIVIYVICVSLVLALINRLLRWQTEVQKKLKDAARTALNAGQAKSQFLAQMSHEIRTPINAVLGMNEMILRESEDKDIREYSENIASAGRTLLNLINSILDFSKIEDGKMEIIPARYETLNMVDDLVNMIYEKANQKNLSLITKIDPNLPKVLFGDDMRVKQVITNILSNAVKYTEEGTVTLTMSGEIVDDDNLILYVSVKDTGIGIREEDIEKLFQSFIRLDETKNKNIEGTGLGISIVKELLHMMNSHLEVSSVYGKGSDFSFKLPQKIIDKTPVGVYGEHHADRKLKRVETKNFIKAPAARILAVDDMNMNLKVINGLLKRNLIVPDLADSGEQCLQFAAKYFYHIIFLDHMMPKMDGVETLKRLKAMNLPAETKIIMLTANAISGARERYLAKGFDDYLSKPIDTDDLEAILAKYLPPEIILSDDEPAHVEEDLPSIDMDTALSNCMNSKEFFAEMAEEFINSDKTADLNAALTAQDLKAYRVASHALKSTALVIGAVKLSDKAKAQEFVAKDGRLDEVKRNHDDLLATYKTVLDELRAWLKLDDEPAHVEDDLPSIDMNTALSNCMNSKEFFVEMAGEFINSDKTADLNAALTAQDLKAYRVASHALKSTALVIGAVKLSDKAKAQEFVAKDGRLDEVKRNHDDLLATYKTVREELDTWRRDIQCKKS